MKFTGADKNKTYTIDDVNNGKAGIVFEKHDTDEERLEVLRQLKIFEGCDVKI